MKMTQVTWVEEGIVVRRAEGVCKESVSSKLQSALSFSSLRNYHLKIKVRGMLPGF